MKKSLIPLLARSLGAFFVLISFIFTPIHSSNAAPPLIGIYGGTPVSSDLYKKIAAVGTGLNFCSAARIAPGWLITAAHCIVSGPAVFINFYSQDSDRHADKVEKSCNGIRSIGYPGWKEGSADFPDIALVEIDCRSPDDPHFELPGLNFPVRSGFKIHQVGAGLGTANGGFTELAGILETPADFLADKRISKADRAIPQWSYVMSLVQSPDVLIIKADSTATNAEGDSGGLIYFHESGTHADILFGVIHGLIVLDGTLQSTVADLGTNIATEKSLAFIHKYVH